MIRPLACPPLVQSSLARSAALYEVSVHEILSDSQRFPLALARASVSIELRKAGYSLPAIARHLRKSHTTIMYYLRGCKRRRLVEPDAPPYDPNAPDESGVWAI